MAGRSRVSPWHFERLDERDARGSHHSTMTSDNAFAKRMKYQSIGLLQCLFYNYYFKHKQ